MAAAAEHSNDMENESPERPYLSNNNVANNQISIVPDMPLVKINAAELTLREKEKMYRMYVETYASAGYGSRFDNESELFKKYPCILAIRRYYTRAFVLVQHKQHYNKISAVCHNNTPLGKAILWHMLRALLTQPGTIIEASGAVSWILRKNGIAPIITDPNVIRTAIDLKPNEQLIITPNYDFTKRDNQYYTRITYKQKNGAMVEDRKEETLFGLPIGCTYDTNDCKRKCTQYINLASGGKRKSHKRKQTRVRKTRTKNKVRTKH